MHPPPWVQMQKFHFYFFKVLHILLTRGLWTDSCWIEIFDQKGEHHQNRDGVKCLFFEKSAFFTS
jgi:hypothetical protein